MTKKEGLLFNIAAIIKRDAFLDIDKDGKEACTIEDLKKIISRIADIIEMS